MKLIPGMWWLEPEVLRCLEALNNVVVHHNDPVLLKAMEGPYKIAREVDRGGKTPQSREMAARTVFEGWDGVDWDEGPTRREEWRFEQLANPSS